MFGFGVRVRVRERNKINCILIRSVRRKKVTLITSLCFHLIHFANDISSFSLAAIYHVHQRVVKNRNDVSQVSRVFIGVVNVVKISDRRCEGQPFSC